MARFAIGSVVQVKGEGSDLFVVEERFRKPNRFRPGEDTRSYVLVNLNSGLNHGIEREDDLISTVFDFDSVVSRRVRELEDIIARLRRIRIDQRD